MGCDSPSSVMAPIGLRRSSDDLRRNCDYCVKKKVGARHWICTIQQYRGSEHNKQAVCAVCAVCMCCMYVLYVCAVCAVC